MVSMIYKKALTAQNYVSLPLITFIIPLPNALQRDQSN